MTTTTNTKNFLISTGIILVALVLLNLYLYISLSDRVNVIDRFFHLAEQEGTDFLNRDQKFQDSIYQNFEAFNDQIQKLQSDTNALKKQTRVNKPIKYKTT